MDQSRNLRSLTAPETRAMHRFDRASVLTSVAALLRCCRPIINAAAAIAIALVAGTAMAGVPWHSDLAQAKAASVISHRPVLIVFTAKWSEASMALDQTTLANEEAVALVTACFEPVKIDVDADPETTRRMGVSYLPTACVIDLDDRVLATFDCPDSPASFIAAAGRAAQDAASAKAGPQQPSDGAVAAAMAQARTHSAFTAPQAAAPPAPPSAPSASAQQIGAVPTEPSLPSAPPTTWPAERPASRLPTALAADTGPPAPTTAPPTVAHRASIDPAPSTQPQPPQATGMAPWLGATATTPPPAPSATPQTASAPPPTPGATALPTTAPQAAPEEKPKQTNAFVAALQKPFAFLPKWPGTRPAEATPKPEQTAATPPAAAAAPANDPYGTMPLGLEGYCAVTLLERGQWVEGRAQYGARHRGRTYLFAGPEQQKAFLADPDRYSPALSGDDPVMAFDAGKSIPGQRRYGVTYQARVYLFSSPETRTAFSADPQKYTARVAMAEGRATSGAITR